MSKQASGVPTESDAFIDAVAARKAQPLAPELAHAVTTTGEGITVTLRDGRTASLPLSKRLQAATPEQRQAANIYGGGMVVSWEEADEDIGVHSFLGLTEADIEQFVDEQVTQRCAECGEPADDGEGWNGLCGNCADRAELESKS